MPVAAESKPSVVFETSDMSAVQFKIFLDTLRKGPITVNMRALQAAMAHDGPFEENAGPYYPPSRPQPVHT